MEKRILRQQNGCPCLRSGIRENIKGLRTRLNTKQSDEQLAFAQTISSDCLTAVLSPLSFPSDSSKVAGPPICCRRKVLPIAALSLSCASSIPRRHDSFPVNLTVRREYVKGTPLEKKTYTDLWHISSGFLMTGCTVDNVPLSQSLLNREIVEGRGPGAVEGRGVHRGPCSNAGIWGVFFAPLCAAALQPRAKACPRWISSSFPSLASSSLNKLRFSHRVL